MEREKRMNIERLHILEEHETKITVSHNESKAVLLDVERRYLHSINECDASVPGTVNHRILAEKQNRDRLDFVKCSKQFQGAKVLTSHARLPRNQKRFPKNILQFIPTQSEHTREGPVGQKHLKGL